LSQCFSFQIFRDYSPHCPNIELLRIWGFVDPNVPFEVAALNLELDPKEQFLDVKLQWLKDSSVITYTILSLSLSLSLFLSFSLSLFLSLSSNQT
jgi:hypothetical protein